MNENQKLSFVEKAGYSAADAAANFVFMTMILFQTNFYTDVFGLAAGTAATILLCARLWDAFADPMVGILADRTKTRWGKFRPWVICSAIPWCIVMVLAYTTPQGWDKHAMIMYAAITNVMLMSIYSINNMPYAALGGVMTGDVNERAKLNSFRFIAVNAAQFIVGGFTLPLVAHFALVQDKQSPSTFSVDDVKQLPAIVEQWKGSSNAVSAFVWQSLPNQEQILLTNYQSSAVSSNNARAEVVQALNKIIAGPSIYETNRFQGVSLRPETTALIKEGPVGPKLARLNLLLLEDAYPVELPRNFKQYGWQMTMTVWSALCLVLFVITFVTTRERIQPPPQQKSDPKADFSALFKSAPWIVMCGMTLFHFAMLSFRGGALYNYYHHYVDKAAMYDFIQKLGLTAPTAPAPGQGGIMDTLGLIVYKDIANSAQSNVADVFNSFINMLNTGTTIIVILLSPPLARAFGKKAVAVVGFSLSTVCALGYYLLGPTNTTGMVALTFVAAVVYAPTVPLIWAIYADVADYSEWKVGRRFTGIVFATIGFALKTGLALGSASFLWIMEYGFGYDTNLPDTPDAIKGYVFCSGIAVAALFGACAILLTVYKLNKRMTIQMADELAERRKGFGAQPA